MNRRRREKPLGPLALSASGFWQRSSGLTITRMSDSPIWTVTILAGSCGTTVANSGYDQDAWQPWEKGPLCWGGLAGRWTADSESHLGAAGRHTPTGGVTRPHLTSVRQSRRSRVSSGTRVPQAVTTESLNQMSHLTSPDGLLEQNDLRQGMCVYNATCGSGKKKPLR